MEENQALKAAADAAEKKHNSAMWPLGEGEASTLRQVIIVHRHGTRFPTKPTGAGNISWPQRAQFWSSYKGHLTPVGSKQLQDIGKVLKHRYSQVLFGGRKIDGRVIAAYTSNIQRTLQSAWSFLLGLVPSASIFFAFRSERVFSDALRQAAGVPIYVEDATNGDDKLFHEWTIAKGYKQWLKENQARSAFLQQAKNDPEYVELIDYLYAATGEEKLKPGLDPLKRLVGAKDVDTLVTIDQAHKRPLLPNEQGKPLMPRQVKKLREVGDEVKRCWFADANGDVNSSWGKQGAGYLAHKIWRHMDERARDACHLRFAEFSCHDTTMCALAAHLGIELPGIGFGAFFIFELHRDATDGHVVKFYYNSHPDRGAPSYAALQSRVLPLAAERIQKLQDCPLGHVPLSSLQAHCQIPGQEETFEAFVKLLGRADLGPTRDDLEALLQTGKIGWLSFQDWQELYHDAFRGFDANGDGVLCKTEMQAALLEWYGLSGKTIDLVFHLVDRDPEKDFLTERDVYLAMCALVGVRGSISANTAGGVVTSGAQEAEPQIAENQINARVGTDGTTKLMTAANVGDVQRVKDLVAKGANVNIADDYGWTALRYAVRKRNTAVVRELLALKADVNQSSKSGRTPLMSAVANKAPDVAELLLQNGADLAARNHDGLTAYDLAACGERSDGMLAILQLLEPVMRAA